MPSAMHSTCPNTFEGPEEHPILTSSIFIPMRKGPPRAKKHATRSTRLYSNIYPIYPLSSANADLTALSIFKYLKGLFALAFFAFQKAPNREIGMPVSETSFRYFSGVGLPSKHSRILKRPHKTTNPLLLRRATFFGRFSLRVNTYDARSR